MMGSKEFIVIYKLLHFCFRNNKKILLMATISISVVTVIAVVILLVVFLSGNNQTVRASVVTNGYGCSEIGM